MQTEFEPRNPNYESVVRDSFSRQPYMADIGARIDLIEPGICELSLETRPGLTQQHGFFHGGLVAALADSAAGYACYSLYPPNSTVLTTEFKVSFLNPAQGGRLKAKGRVVKAGKTLFVCQADAYAEEAGKTSHCLTGLFTMMCLMGKSDALNLGREAVST
ncbi:PaaI family thioesterase [Sneathiella sp.]|uniref:PaaI family thioesterase n=1 Tax=Sneathiella sp. TaxID=1964365 RepID=UPI002621D24D|nr:PaaI family thioesterase [Sneathiella sp.]MDF2366958.1 PaaI family thioesterase [Sneathiella sp.]